MELGFTGSRLGMTAAQMTAFGEFIDCLQQGMIRHDDMAAR